VYRAYDMLTAILSGADPVRIRAEE
jgi:hypothetical protein